MTGLSMTEEEQEQGYITLKQNKRMHIELVSVFGCVLVADGMPG